MQEVSQVGWDPVSINYHLPWASKLLILYLLVVSAILLVKSAAVLRLLRSLPRGSRRVPRIEDEPL
jgi:predicted DCC family thiol-disulfide oxidoreductase YuxK